MNASRHERVYLIGSANSPLVKIGQSDNPKARLRNLQTGSPVILRILAEFAGGRFVESELHKHFADRRSHGEWFDLGDSPVEAVKEVIKLAQAKEAEQQKRPPKHEIRYDHISIEEWSQWMPDDPPAVYERMVKECPTWKQAEMCLCDTEALDTA